MKKKYYKPEIKSVKLEAQEAVLTGCKLAGPTGAGAPTDCKYKGNKCSDLGS